MHIRPCNYSLQMCTATTRYTKVRFPIFFITFYWSVLLRSSLFYSASTIYTLSRPYFSSFAGQKKPSTPPDIFWKFSPIIGLWHKPILTLYFTMHSKTFCFEICFPGKKEEYNNYTHTYSIRHTLNQFDNMCLFSLFSGKIGHMYKKNHMWHKITAYVQTQCFVQMCTDYDHVLINDTWVMCTKHT